VYEYTERNSVFERLEVENLETPALSYIMAIVSVFTSEVIFTYNILPMILVRTQFRNMLG
jgi:hypothetical protein